MARTQQFKPQSLKHVLVSIVRKTSIHIICSVCVYQTTGTSDCQDVLRVSFSFFHSSLKNVSLYHETTSFCLSYFFVLTASERLCFDLFSAGFRKMIKVTNLRQLISKCILLYCHWICCYQFWLGFGRYFAVILPELSYSLRINWSAGEKKITNDHK